MISLEQAINEIESRISLKYDSIGEFLLTSLFTFSSFAYDLTHRSHGSIY